jgi:mRNA interferase RelE/StbE
LVWTINYTATALKALKKLDKAAAKKILQYLEKIALLENPKTQGKALTGAYKTYWRYRVGDDKVICQLNNHQLTLLVLQTRHRKEVYDA